MAVLDTITGADVKVYSQVGPSSYVTGGFELDASADFSWLGFVDLANIDSPSQLVLDGLNAYTSTPDDAALDITGDIDIAFLGRIADWSPANGFYAVTKAALFSTTSTSYALIVNAAGQLQLAWSVAGTTIIFVNATAAVPFTDGTFGLGRVTMDVNDGAGNRVIKFYTKTYDPTVNPLTQVKSAIATWTQLGSTVTTAGTTSIFNSTQPVRIGKDGNLSITGLGMVKSDILAACIRSGIEGTVVADPDFSIQEPGDDSFTDAAGRTWTIQDNGEIERQLAACVAEVEMNVDSAGSETFGKAMVKLVRERFDHATVGNVSGNPAGTTVQAALFAAGTTTGSSHTHAFDHDHPIESTTSTNAAGLGVATGGAFNIDDHSHTFDVANFVGTTTATTHAHNRAFEYDHDHSVSAPTVTDVAATEVASGTDLRAVTFTMAAYGFGKS